VSRRILVLSDTHGSKLWMEKALTAAGRIDEIFHLGDHVRDAVSLADQTKLPVSFVKGNCDFGDFPLKEMRVVCGKRILLTHGHQLAVKYTLDRLIYAGEEANADAVLYGHTHRAYLEFSGGLLLLNPGSAAEPRDGGKHTAAILSVSPEGIVPGLIAL